MPIFFSCSSRLPDLDEELEDPWYDVRKQFLSTVPVLLYLKWALRTISWRAHEAGACFIVDDPILKQRYGFCDFPRLDAQMQKHSFTTSIAMIPWNSNRTSPAMASLMKQSEAASPAAFTVATTPLESSDARSRADQSQSSSRERKNDEPRDGDRPFAPIWLWSSRKASSQGRVWEVYSSISSSPR